jgi:redox-sensitive bicupin YhaK (pirin superfamily)
MISLRPFRSLGGGHHGWLDAHHHFAFGQYQDEERSNWGKLRVWNDDEIAPGSGFPAHPHANMEIITYVREGAITHVDSLGNKGRTEAGDVQVMSAGSGVRHAEYNAELISTSIFQIWIMPTALGGAPSWGSRSFPKQDRAGTFAVLASGFPEDHQALPIRSDARVIGITLPAGSTAVYSLSEGRLVYLVPATGLVEVNGLAVAARDGAAISEETSLHLHAIEATEIVLVETA